MDDDNDAETHNILAIDAKLKSSEKKNYGCFNMAAFGQCKSKYCKKSHNEIHVAEAAHYWLGVFQESKYNINKKPNLARTLNHIYDICALTSESSKIVHGNRTW